MNNFSYERAMDTQGALRVLGDGKVLAGGTNLVDLMREEIEQPEKIVDITRLPLAEIEMLPDGGMRIGALVRNSHLAAHAEVRKRYRLISEAILNGASAQLRNMATTGGNLMQRTRCYYFYDDAANCNKRKPGSGCDAIGGFNRIHAILGASEECIATHPSDMCVALTALDATVQVEGAHGKRSIAMRDFHRLPGETPNKDTNLEAGELITHVDLPVQSANLPSLYRKVRDRASYAFALVSVAAAMTVEGGKISEIRVAMGGVAHKPWRAQAAEELLRGKEATHDNFVKAAAVELAPAKAQSRNAFKIELAKRTIVSVLDELAGGAR